MKLPDCNNRIGNWLNLTNSKKIPRHLLIYKNALENLDRFSHLGLSSSYLYRYKNWKDLAIFQDKWGEFVRTSFTWKLVSLQLHLESLQLHLETRRFVQKYMKSSCTVQFKQLMTSSSWHLTNTSEDIPTEVEDIKWKKENINGSEAQLIFYLR